MVLNTICILNYKRFSDFTFHSAFRILDTGIGGFVFRVKDEYEFYLLEFDKDGFLFSIFENGI